VTRAGDGILDPIAKNLVGKSFNDLKSDIVFDDMILSPIHKRCSEINASI